MRTHRLRAAGFLTAVLLISALIGPTAAATSVSAWVGVGDAPYGIGVDAARERAYVANGGSGNVTVIDTATSQVLATVRVGGSPAMVAVDSARGRVYVSNFDTADIAVIDAATSTVIGTLAPGGLGLAVDGTRGLLYATGGSVLTVFDVVSGASVATVSAGGGSWWGVALDASAGRLYLQDLSRSAVVVLDSTSYAEVARIAVAGESRFGVTVDPALGVVYVPNYSSAGSISVIDTATYAVTRTVAVGSSPFALALDGSRLYSADLGSGTVTVLATSPELVAIETVSTGGAPAGVAVLPGGQRVYVSDNANDRVVILAAEAAANRAPVIESATISPADPVTTSTLTASVAARDADGDGLTYMYQWTRNGVDIAGATAQTLDLAAAGNGDKGDAIAVRVVASDGDRSSVPVASDPVRVRNSAPLVSVSLSSSAPSTRDVLVASVTSSDADGDALTFTYQWTRNGVDIVGATARTLDLGVAGNGDKGDAIAVRVVASDGDVSSAPVTSDPARVVNSAPLVSVSLSSSSPSTREVLVATAAPSDADADPVTLTYVWKVNGVVRRSVTTIATTDPFDLRAPQNGNIGDTITVDVTPSDGEAVGSMATASATVRRGG